MNISDIKFNEKNSLFEITINDEKFNISYEVYEDLELKIEKQLTINMYNIIEEESMYQDAKKIASNYINYKQRTRFEVENRLKRSISNLNIIEKVIDYYNNLNLLDDDKYTKEYLDYQISIKNNSKVYAKNKLMQKGIDTTLINKYLLNYDDSVELENAKILYNKKFEDVNIEDKKQVNKVYRYMSGRGFNYYIIKQVIGESR